MIKDLIADLARPFAIIVTAMAAAIATVRVAWAVSDGNDGALFIGAVYAGVGAIYGFKALEVFKTNRAAADVEVAKAVASTPAAAAPAPGTAVVTAASDVSVEATVTSNEQEPLPWPPKP